MHKPEIWANVIFLMLLLIALIWILVGCVPKKEHQQDGSRVIVYQEEIDKGGMSYVNIKKSKSD